jgi:hypothetical protein
MKKLFSFSVLVTICFSTMATAQASTLSGSEVTVTAEAPFLGNPISLPNTGIVPASFPSGSIVPLPGIDLFPVNIEVNATSIDFQFLATATVGASTFDGYVFDFTGAPTVTGVSLITNLPLPVVLGFTSDEVSVNWNPQGQSFTPSSVITVDVALASSAVPEPRSDALILTSLGVIGIIMLRKALGRVAAS